MYLIIDQGSVAGVFNNSCPNLEELFQRGNAAVPCLPGGQSIEIGPNLRRKDAHRRIA